MITMINHNPVIKHPEIFSTENPTDLAHYYDRLAAEYENEMGLDYAVPEQSVALLCRQVDFTARILDAGCGTGLIGQLLHTRGYTRVEGLDLSTGMLAGARAKNCYAALHQGALGKNLDFPTATFDAVVCGGVFVRGHAAADSLDELIRITKSGGIIAFTLRPEFYENSDFKDKMANLEKAGHWHLLEISAPFLAMPTNAPDLQMRVWIYKTGRI